MLHVMAAKAGKNHRSMHRKPRPKNWVKGAIKRPGQLHRDLHVPQGEKIPLAKIVSAAQRNDATGQRARLALQLRRMNQGR